VSFFVHLRIELCSQGHLQSPVEFIVFNFDEIIYVIPVKIHKFIYHLSDNMTFIIPP